MTGMATVRSGSALSERLMVLVSPSATAYVFAPKDTDTWGSSSSMMETVVSPFVPALTRGGSVSNSSLTLSPSSSSVSCSAVKVNDLEVSPELNVTLDGTPE